MQINLPEIYTLHNAHAVVKTRLSKISVAPCRLSWEGGGPKFEQEFQISVKFILARRCWARNLQKGKVEVSDPGMKYFFPQLLSTSWEEKL